MPECEEENIESPCFGGIAIGGVEREQHLPMGGFAMKAPEKRCNHQMALTISLYPLRVKGSKGKRPVSWIVETPNYREYYVGSAGGFSERPNHGEQHIVFLPVQAVVAAAAPPYWK